MSYIVGGLIIAVFAGALVGLAWMSVRARKRAIPGVSAALASYNEVFQPTAHDSHWELRTDEERKAPTPSPDDL
ncbi:hypothetical protein Afil01_63660 [Actinorhabdospora filicis]|uniref:Secreted protein n=1 Tax=Actinorhabdospora filicis TaxID=1785913 RepID=A0A9W6WCE3_9ACTN|nr:hypothetical protein [Actinorhabdospora filicis]GLZ81559.1 hypothetical protein Afil01_63660 [Actinorhabdospora filicis]